MPAVERGQLARRVQTPLRAVVREPIYVGVRIDGFVSVDDGRYRGRLGVEGAALDGPCGRDTDEGGSARLLVSGDRVARPSLVRAAADRSDHGSARLAGVLVAGVDAETDGATDDLRACQALKVRCRWRLLTIKSVMPTTQTQRTWREIPELVFLSQALSWAVRGRLFALYRRSYLCLPLVAFSSFATILNRLQKSSPWFCPRRGKKVSSFSLRRMGVVGLNLTSR